MKCRCDSQVAENKQQGRRVPPHHFISAFPPRARPPLTVMDARSYRSRAEMGQEPAPGAAGEKRWRCQ